MKSTELRIGNIIEFFDSELGFSNIVVDADTIKNVQYHNDDEFDNMDNYYNAIPLTEEWLVKFGFEKVNGYGYKIFGNWLQKEDGIFWYNVNGNFIEIKSVHQLQNLYHALTGEELTIKS